MTTIIIFKFSFIWDSEIRSVTFIDSSYIKTYKEEAGRGGGKEESVEKNSLIKMLNCRRECIKISYNLYYNKAVCSLIYQLIGLNIGHCFVHDFVGGKSALAVDFV